MLYVVEVIVKSKYNTQIQLESDEDGLGTWDVKVSQVKFVVSFWNLKSEPWPFSKGHCINAATSLYA